MLFTVIINIANVVSPTFETAMHKFFLNMPDSQGTSRKVTGLVKRIRHVTENTTHRKVFSAFRTLFVMVNRLSLVFTLEKK